MFLLPFLHVFCGRLPRAPALDVVREARSLEIEVQVTANAFKLGVHRTRRDRSWQF